MISGYTSSLARISFIGVCLLCNTFIVSGQDRQLVDSLLTALSSTTGTAQINLLQEIAYEHSESDSALVYAELAAKKSEALSYYEGIATSFHFIGKRYGRQRNSEQALHYFDEALAAAKKWNNLHMEGKILGEIGYTLSVAGKMEKAQEIYLQSLKIAERTGDRKMIARSHFELGDFYRLQHDVNNAIAYLEKAMKYHEDENDVGGQARIIYTKGITYKVAKAPHLRKNGPVYLERLLESPYFETLPQHAVSKVYTSLGSMYAFEEDFEKAEPYLLKSLELKKARKDSVSMAFSLNELATLYMNMKQYDKSIKYGEEVLRMMADKDAIFLKYDNYKNLAVAYAGEKDYLKAYEYLSLNAQLRDSVLNQEKAVASVELETKYQNAINQEKIAKHELELAEHRNRTIILILIILFAGFALFIWMRTRMQFIARETAQLENLNKTKNRLFTNISHELRTPLTLLINPLQNLLDQTKKAGEIKITAAQLSPIVKNGERMERMIRQLMQLSKSDEGQLRLEAREQDLVVFIRELVYSFEAYALLKKVKLEFFTTEESLPMYFDPAKMEDIMINLLSNAFKFTEAGGIVKVLLSKVNKQASIQVQDNGRGIEADRLPFIFDRFYQVDDSDTRAKDGMGVGLAIVREMVRLHHGTIKVDSKPGDGTRFSLSFPIGSAHLAAAEINQFKEYLPQKIQRLGNEKRLPDLSQSNENTQLPVVLIVEDNLDLLNYLQEQLLTFYNVLAANNAQEGLRLALEHIPDLVMSDVMMPQMNGFDFCKQLKMDERTSHIPVVLLTAKADREEIMTGLQSGADDYVTKPFDQALLLTKIGNLIDQRNRLRLAFADKITVQPSEVEVLSVDDQFLKKVLEIVENRMSDPRFGIDELSHEVNMSRSQLYRKLKALTDQTPTAFLRTIRLERARQLLQKSAGNATEIAYLVGFNNPNYFFKCFKDHFGRTPKEMLAETEEQIS